MRGCTYLIVTCYAVFALIFVRGLFSSEEKQEEWIWRGGDEVEERDWEERKQGKLQTECNNKREKSK